jgi:carbonic anhydrase
MNQKISLPIEALEALKKGNERFLNNLKMNRDYLQEMQATKDGQAPFAVIISCMDSRTSVEIIFDQGLGDLFSIRIAGNVVTPEVIASVEYACKVVGSSLVIVLGHTGCGAVQGAINNVQLGQLNTILDRIKDNATFDKATPPEKLQRMVTEENVKAGVLTLTEQSEVLRDLVNEAKIKIYGGIYDISTGEVSFWE